MTVVFYEIDNLHRQIYTDGRTLPEEFELPAYLGYSVGHWDHNVFTERSTAATSGASMSNDLLPDSDIFEIFCNENEKDRSHLQKQ